ncbi:MAG: PD-(D/E)XK nuclease-like domain-containing protein [Chloroflexi bacterium]|nr:PD-(D/E)XK nuclease-like domain-containing protein [Chloroflexota bacterium]
MTKDTNDEQFREDFNLGEAREKAPAAEVSREGWRLIPDVDLEAYYADQLTPDPSLSNSGMKYLLDETPLDFAFQHPRLNPDAEAIASTVAQRRGDVVHQLALGKGRGYAIAEFADWRSGAAKSFRDNAIADGLTPIKRADFDEAEIMAGVIRDRIKEALDGAAYETEVAIVWQEQTSAGPIWVRGLMDVWCEELATILDPKVTAMLYDGKVARQMLAMGWDRQASLYPHGVGMVRPDLAGRVKFADLMVKPSAPYTSRLVGIEKGWEYSSIKQCQLAIERFGRCLYAGRWPGFGNTVERLVMPPWEDKRREAIELGEGA